MKMPSKTIIAIISIGILEAIALFRGIDGAYLSMAIAAMAGLGGFSFGALSTLLRKPEPPADTPEKTELTSSR